MVLKARSKNSLGSTLLAHSVLPYRMEFPGGRAEDALLSRSPVWEFSPAQQRWFKAAAISAHFLFILAKVSTKSSGTASKCYIFIAFWSVQSFLNSSCNGLSFCFAFLLVTVWFRNWCFWHIFKLSFKINTFPRGEGNLRP